MGMTNRDWLFSLPLEEQIAWMESEHSEPNPDCSAMLYKLYTENMKQEPCSHYEPKDDAVSIMRECAETGHSMRVLRGRLGVECVSGWQMRCLGKLADMIERDYVRRDAVEEVMDNDRALVEENAKLASELEAAKLQIGQSDALKSGETSENPASKDDIRDFDDSREKLEADVRKHYSHTTSTLMYPPSANKQTDWLASMPMDTVFGWLNRQAAITQHEITERWAEHLHPIERECGDLRRKVAELTAERDELKELNGYHAVQYELASEDCDRLQAQVDELTAECDELKRANSRQARKIHGVCEINEKLTAERDNLEANNQQLHTLAGEQAATIDELQAQVDELTNAGRKMSTELANMQDYITKVRAGRERYRSMCSEMATKIHDALMVMDEGMA